MASIPKGFISLGFKDLWLNTDYIVGMKRTKGGNISLSTTYGQVFILDPKLVNKELMNRYEVK